MQSFDSESIKIFKDWDTNELPNIIELGPKKDVIQTLKNDSVELINQKRSGSMSSMVLKLKTMNRSGSNTDKDKQEENKRGLGTNKRIKSSLAL